MATSVSWSSPIGNLSFQPEAHEYRAVFTDATGVVKGDEIRIAGVKVGTVKDVEIVERTRALVTFDVAEDPGGARVHHGVDPLPQPGRSALHLAGRGHRRHGAARGGGDYPGGPDEAGARPDRAVQRLRAAVFQALSPTDINQLSYEIVQVFQGEGGTLEGLLGHTASVTSTLAERDEVIS